MTPERYQQIGRLYQVAVTLELAQRSAFLQSACAEDEALRQAVKQLLAADEQAHAQDFIAEPAQEIAAEMLAQARAQRLVGQSLSHYQILSLLGVGGMGEVWLARDSQLERKVALKLLPSQFTQNPERLQRFRREARAASALNHPNIITIYEIGAAEGQHFIATEFIDGITLRQRLAEGRLDLREALAIVRQIVEALDTAHQAGIIHRDIKPENLMIRHDRLVKVLDFGLAKLAEGKRDGEKEGPSEGAKSGSFSPNLFFSLSQTNPSAVMGTPHYMSPEQARGLKVDARTDVFSLGVVFYEMVTGAQPFAGATEAEVFAALLEKELPPLSHFIPEFPGRLEAIIRRLLAKEREERYETIRAFAVDLSQLDLTPSHSSAGLRTQTIYAHDPRRKRTETEAQDAQTTVPSQSRPLANLRQPRFGWPIAVLALAAALGLGVWRWIAERGNESGQALQVAADATFTPLIGEAGAKECASISPDETRIAFAWDGGKNVEVSPRDIYVKVIGTDGPPLRLTTSPEDDGYPVWTPDGKYVTFVRMSLNRNETSRNEVMRVPARGGPEQKLGETNSAAAWSPDGKTLAVTHHPGWFGSPESEAGGGVILLSLETGRRTRLTVPPPDSRDTLPRFAPDGKQVAFVRGTEPTKTGIFVVSANGGAPKQITAENNRIMGLTWTSDSREIVYAGVQRGARGMWRLRVSGGEPERVPIAGQAPLWPDISRRGNKLIWTEAAVRDTNLWLYRGPGFAGRAVPGNFDAPTKLPSSSIQEDSSPNFSPDGQRLVFASSRTGGQELWVSDADGNNAVRLTIQGGPTGSPRWSPDGKWIAFDSQIGGDGNIYVISASGGRWRRLTPESTAETLPAWSRDGQWIYFKSNRSGSMQIHKMPAVGGESRQITFQGGFEGAESPDGSLFYYTKARGEYGIYAVPASGGEEKLVPELSRAGYWRSWSVVKEGICFIAKEDAPQQTIRFFSFATRRITPLITVNHEALWWLPGLALSPDGKRLLYAQLENINDEIMLMEHFR